MVIYYHPKTFELGQLEKFAAEAHNSLGTMMSA